MKLWHDDVRRPPDPSWIWARTNEEAILRLICQRRAGDPVLEMSMDHDLGGEDLNPDDPDSWIFRGGSEAGSGLDLAWCMVRLNLVPPSVTIHSWNPDGARAMQGVLSLAGVDAPYVPYRPPSMDDDTYGGMFP